MATITLSNNSKNLIAAILLLAGFVFGVWHGVSYLIASAPVEDRIKTRNDTPPFDLDRDQVVKLGLYGAECVDGKLSYREPQPDGSTSLKTYTIFRDRVDRGMHFGVTEHIRCTSGSQGNPI
ncbi:hypothetical protein N0754_18745 [Pseudomonas aeruginosa]|nr:hypothetical protein [Pseudomonas aeruginosa]MCS9764275.1 hypothetical protein [Pseudomonas aeruginosa]MCS9820451.1 hypothetical protein [Pseudomonas aeruginosa]MCT0241032.1 hypothetical protein [Pseudomonas aeruginosa]MCT0528485.1 hypothetical protein [Pseudomonas aeruginosa]